MKGGMKEGGGEGRKEGGREGGREGLKEHVRTLSDDLTHTQNRKNLCSHRFGRQETKMIILLSFPEYPLLPAASLQYQDHHRGNGRGEDQSNPMSPPHMAL